MPTDWPTFIENAYREYKKILTVSCRALDGLRIHFNKHGFNHLIRKGRFPRSRLEQMRRIKLISAAVEIIRNEPTVFLKKEDDVRGSHAIFWTIRSYMNGKWVRVILRKKNNGSAHFFSVMDEK